MPRRGAKFNIQMVQNSTAIVTKAKIQNIL